MPYLRKMTSDQDFMGGVKQTCFSRTTTDISFQNYITQKTKNDQIDTTASPNISHSPGPIDAQHRFINYG